MTSERFEASNHASHCAVFKKRHHEQPSDSNSELPVLCTKLDQETKVEGRKRAKISRDIKDMGKAAGVIQHAQQEDATIQDDHDHNISLRENENGPDANVERERADEYNTLGLNAHSDAWFGCVEGVHINADDGTSAVIRQSGDHSHENKVDHGRLSVNNPVEENAEKEHAVETSARHRQPARDAYALSSANGHATHQQNLAPVREGTPNSASQIPLSDTTADLRNAAVVAADVGTASADADDPQLDGSGNKRKAAEPKKFKPFNQMNKADQLIWVLKSAGWREADIHKELKKDPETDKYSEKTIGTRYTRMKRFIWKHNDRQLELGLNDWSVGDDEIIDQCVHLALKPVEQLVDNMWDEIADLCRKKDPSFSFSGKAVRARWMEYRKNKCSESPPIELRTWLDSSAKRIVRERADMKERIAQAAQANPHPAKPKQADDAACSREQQPLSDEEVGRIVDTLEWMKRKPEPGDFGNGDYEEWVAQVP